MIIMVLILIIMIIYYELETDYKSFIKGLLGVCPGEERHLVVPAALAYGDRSCLQIVGEMKQNCWGNEAKLLGK